MALVTTVLIFISAGEEIPEIGRRLLRAETVSIISVAVLLVINEKSWIILVCMKTEHVAD